MKVNVIQGDLFSSTSGLIVHGCNAQGVMGSGVAKIVKNDYSELYSVYRKEYLHYKNKMTSALPLGNITYARLSQDLYGVNMVTQNKYRGMNGNYDDRRWVSYDAIDIGFRELINMINDGVFGSVNDVNIPMIGAGLGGGDWDIILTILKKCFEGTNLNLNVYYL